jgi:hypothetical protein
VTNLDVSPDRRVRRGPLPAVGLFLLAPLFGEFLLGNLKISELALLPFLGLLYGLGALLIREAARRFGRGSAAMVTLGVAYALIEEGLVDQMLFNPNYFAGQAEASDTSIGWLGVDAELTIIVVAMHAIWSTYIPIALVESLTPRRRTTPWLGPVGTVVAVVVFVAGSTWLAWVVYRDTGFLASPAQLAGTSVVVVALIALAFRLPQPSFADGSAAGESASAESASGGSAPVGPAPVGPATVGPAPRPWLVGLVAFVASSLFMLTEELPGWAEVAASLLLVAVVAVAVTRWSRRPGFGERHRLALVAGAVLTYAWLGLVMPPESGPKTTFDHVGSVLLAGFAIALVALALRRRPRPGR